MKIISFNKILIPFLLVCIVSCATMDTSKIYGIDEAIQEASLEVGTNLPQGTKVAVVNFGSTSEPLSNYVVEELSLALAKNKNITVVDRKNLDLIQQETHFQLSGEVDDASAVEIGHKLGAQFIITGSFANAGTYYRFRVNAINVATAAKEAPVSIQVNNKDEQVVYFLNLNKNDDGARNEVAEQPETKQSVNPLGREDVTVSPSVAIRLFEELLIGNYPPIIIIPASAQSKTPGNFYDYILFSPNMDKPYYLWGDEWKNVKLGDNWLVQIGTNAEYDEQDNTFRILKNNQKLQGTDEFTNITLPDMVNLFKEYIREEEFVFVIYTGNDGNLYIAATI